MLQLEVAMKFPSQRVSFASAALPVLVLAFVVHSQVPDTTIVKTESGSVQGVAKDGVIRWLGIPYAAPPIGDLRWRLPQAAKNWTGVKTVAEFGPECMQSDDVPKSEDCLTLNVWRPASSKQLLPVMVWIYGGGLIHGQTSLYPAEALAKQGVIVVSMNYRMGRLGFFAHPALAAESPDDVIGNYGYMDQRAALQWVQRNIAAFGGDPAKVTIFGESAGGGSVMSHLTSPMSSGLFRAAIMQSPGIPTSRAKVTPTTELADAEKTATDYARSVGISSDGAQALKELRALPAEKLLEGASTKEVIGSITSEKSIIGVAGSIHDGKFIVEIPEVALANGHQAKVPVMIGSNTLDLWTGNASSKDDLFAVFGA
jgi:para-nitrobenzyl esterase